MDPVTANAHDLALELDWFAAVLGTSLVTYFENDDTKVEVRDFDAPTLGDSAYATFVREHTLSETERLVLILALTPHLRPQLLDILFTKNTAIDRGFSEFGGLQGATHGGFIPTGETAAFLVAGDNLAARFALNAMFSADHVFAREGVLQLRAAAHPEPAWSGALTISPEYLQRFTTGVEQKPSFGSDFPARRIETRAAWNDLILPATTLDQLDEIKHWLTHGSTLMDDWGMRDKMRPGFTALFHGPPGTGKTMAACLLGKHCNSEVYRVDLSMITSKYIGETEKNLAKVFDTAEHRSWILFFDEADALFGKRTRVDSSHDRYANQEVSFLLQRIEEFDGVVILASNLKSNIDEAFLRRFQSVVHFPMPKPAERKKIWAQAFSPRASLEPKIDLARISEKHELSGGTIMNVVRYSSLKALSRNNATILLDDMDEGIRREFLKEGRTT